MAMLEQAGGDAALRAGNDVSAPGGVSSAMRIVKGFTGAPRAWWLSRGMARLMDVDLSREAATGGMSRDDLGAIVSRCGNCTGGPGCEHWIAEGPASRGLPRFCPNRDAILALAEANRKRSAGTPPPGLADCPAPGQESRAQALRGD